MLTFVVVGLGILLILEYYSGFRHYAQVNLFEEARDAAVAYGIGLAVAALALWILRLLTPGMPVQEVVGKIVLQAIPIGMGASVAISELGEENSQAQRRRREAGFWGTQAVALAGGLLFGFNIAPTVEPMLLGTKMMWWSALLVLGFSLVQVHALVYFVEFKNNARGQRSAQRLLLSSATTYVVALLLSGYLLWTFDRIGPDTGIIATVHMVIALGFATSLGAAAAKIIL